MRYAIISDIHSNIEAFKTVINKCIEEKVDSYICAGDIVGYNASPTECIELIQSLNTNIIVRGNHDEFIGSGKKDLSFFCYVARTTVLWTKSILTLEQLKWLSSLKMSQNISKLETSLVHSSLNKPEKWSYIFNQSTSEENFKYQNTKICIIGHTHIPEIYNQCIESGIISPLYHEDKNMKGKKNNYSYEVKLAPGFKYLINPGSIGQPRDKNPKSSFAIYDTKRFSIKFFRLNYDIKSTCRKIIMAGLPKQLALRLKYGI